MESGANGEGMTRSCGASERQDEVDARAVLLGPGPLEAERMAAVASTREEMALMLVATTA